MPMVLEHIDEIARRLGRDVLVAMPPAVSFWVESPERTNWEELEARREAIAYLASEGIGWTKCFGLEVPGLIIRPYLGEIFIAVPNNSTNLNYKKVCAFFEHPDGSPRHADFQLFLVPLDMAVAARARESRKGDL